jgi:hypothetical protein
VRQSDGRPSSTETEGGEPEPAQPSPKAQPKAQPSPKPVSPMSRTLLTGAALQSTWRLPGLPDNSDDPPPAVEPDGSGVRKLADPADAAAVDAAADAAGQAEAALTMGLADTQKHAATPRPRAAINPKLARTLRMEIGILARPQPDQNAEVVPPTAADSTPVSAAPPRSVWDDHVVPGATQRIGTARESESNQRAPMRGTDPFGRPASAKPRGRPSPAAGRIIDAVSEPHEVAPSSHASAYWSGTGSGHAPRRGPRAGEQTVITRRRRTSARDWLFVGLLVCALGVTASLLLSYRSPSATVSADTDATTVEHAVTAPGEGAAAPGTPGTGTEAQAAAGNLTLIVSTPAGAEVVAGGAVIGNTPVRVARTNFDADYLVRLAGHEPQLVRVMPASPTTIAITLKPTAH